MQPFPAVQLPLNSPDAIFQSRLEWLCQPEQIEQTLCFLYYLNAWKKAHQRLLYADRLGLQEVQALILEQATRAGIVQAAVYLDGTHSFPRELLLESAAENATRGILIHLKGLRDPEIWPPFQAEGDRIYQEFIRPLCRDITGRDFRFVTDAADTVDPLQIREYIQEHLRQLVTRAQATRQPIPLQRLASLCIAPIDLLHIRSNRLCFLDGYDTWEDLDICDQRKLDPEGYSEVAFRYSGWQSRFVFHLPLRWAETFVPPERLHDLQRAPGRSQEKGIDHGILIGEEEGLRHPVKELLQNLGVDIASVCPHKLVEKEMDLTQAAMHDILWSAHNQEQEGWDNDPWLL